VNDEWQSAMLVAVDGVASSSRKSESVIVETAAPTLFGQMGDVECQP
jgi:hypothetical protein